MLSTKKPAKKTIKKKNVSIFSLSHWVLFPQLILLGDCVPKKMKENHDFNLKECNDLKVFVGPSVHVDRLLVNLILFFLWK